MDLLFNDHFHLIVDEDKQNGLVFNRIDGGITILKYEDAIELSTFTKLDTVSGPIIGIFLNSFIVIVKESSSVGVLYEPITKTEHNVHVIKDVIVLAIFNSDLDLIEIGDNLATPITTNINTTSKQASYFTESSSVSEDLSVQDELFSLPMEIHSTSYMSRQSRTKSWNTFRFPKYIKPKFYNQENKSVFFPRDLKRRLISEMTKLFVGTNSFYYSRTIDLTCAMSKKPKVNSDDLWKTADERFFWNRNMLKTLIEVELDCSAANSFIVPILHGFIQIEPVEFPSFTTDRSHVSELFPSMFTEQLNSIVGYITNKGTTSYSDDIRMDSNLDSMLHEKKCIVGLISRRSIQYAGTRYKKRGCDEDGNCANFVETEQLFRYGCHQVSYIIVRGSIPLFWSQPGFKYRPAPIITKSEDENRSAFSKHFQNLFFHYGTNLILIDCTEKTGKEKVVHDAYKNLANELKTCQSEVNYIEFDFHKYCKGKLLMKVDDQLSKFGVDDRLLKSMRYYWHDARGLICEQVGIFRVNCVDCLDRTNIVQRAIALQVLDTQLTRLGLISPDIDKDKNTCRKVMQLLWANNGDILSRQYAGSNALKGDFTRTGERKIYGYLLDTYSSASRYYISKFRDAYRQAAIDAMLGIDESSIENNLLSNTKVNQPEKTKFDDKFEEIDDKERMFHILNDCQVFVDESQQILESWLLIFCDPQIPEFEILLILTNCSYYVMDYDEIAERVNNFQQVLFDDIESIEVSIPSTCSQNSLQSSSINEKTVLRVNYKIDNQSDYYHMLRAASISTDTLNGNQMTIQSVISKMKELLIPKKVDFIYNQKLTKKKSAIIGIVNEATIMMSAYKVKSIDTEPPNSRSKHWTFAQSLEPLLVQGSKRGSAVIKGVSNQVTSRLANISEKLYHKSSRHKNFTVNINMKKSDLEKREHLNTKLHRSSSDTSLENLGKRSSLQAVTVDWPSLESLDNRKTEQTAREALEHEDEFYQDDDYNGQQTMLSMNVEQTNLDVTKNDQANHEQIGLTAMSYDINYKNTKVIASRICEEEVKITSTSKDLRNID